MQNGGPRALTLARTAIIADDYHTAKSKRETPVTMGAVAPVSVAAVILAVILAVMARPDPAIEARARLLRAR